MASVRAAAASRSRFLLIAVCVAVVAVLYILAARRMPLGILNDDAANVLLSQSLRQGRYAFPGDLGAPEEFLPAFPVILILPTLIVEPHWNLLQTIPLAFVVLSLWLTWRLARRFLGVEASAAVVALTALNPVLVGLGGLVMPYLPYLALSLALIDRVADVERPRSFVLLTAGAALAPLLRPQGVVLILFLAMALWRRHGARKAAGFLAGALLPIAIWTLRNRLTLGASQDYLHIWRARIAESGDMAAQMGHASRLLSKMFAQGVFGLVDVSSAAQIAVAVTALGCAGVGAVRVLRQREDLRMFVLSGYVAGLLLLHMSWQWVSPRYTISFVPLLWIPIIVALEPRLRGRRFLAAAVLALLLARPLQIDVFLARKGLAMRPQFQPSTMAWIRENTPASARVESVKNYSVALLTRRVCGTQRLVSHFRDWMALAQRDGVDYMHVKLPRPDDELSTFDRESVYQPAFAGWLRAQKGVTESSLRLDEGTVVFHVEHPASKFTGF